MLEFVETLTLAPWEVGARDWDDLRAQGMNDRQIAQVVLGCAHFNYLNRMADGLGIAFEYPKTLEPFAAGSGERRRAEVAARAKAAGAVPLHARASTRPDPALADRPDLPPDAPRALLATIAALQEAAAGGIAQWWAHHFTGTPALPLEVRVAAGLFAAGLEHCQSARDSLDAMAARLHVRGTADLAQGEIPRDCAARERLVLEHTRRLIRSPASCRREHVDALRAAGLDDRDILQLTEFVAYLSFQHRVAFGLGAAPKAP